MKRALLALLIVVSLAGCASSSSEAPDDTLTDDTASSSPSSAETDPSGGFETVTPSAACEESMAAAASVPLDAVNDAEFAATAAECSSVDEWASALYAHPDALGLSDLTDQDITWALQATCATNEGTPVCADASARGLMD
jgi:hypothetical protein